MKKKEENIQIRSLGDAAIVLQFGEGIDPSIHEKVINFVAFIEANPFQGFIEAVPCYNSVTIFYHPPTIHRQLIKNRETSAFAKVKAIIEDYLTSLDRNHSLERKRIDIPVLYGGEFGPDLEEVAKHNHLSEEEVIQLHTETDYMVYMIGFAPGFPFLGGMNPAIATPRKAKPRAAIPAGSVGIAGKQTGIYPLETPGGWQIIGRTPLDLFLPDQEPPSLLNAGDYIRFVPITLEQYQSYKEVEG